MAKLNCEPIRRYWLVLFIVPAGILVETAAAIAEARPFKDIVDIVVSNHHLPRWLTDSVGPLPGGASKMLVLAFEVLLLVAIAAASAMGRRRTAHRAGRVIAIKRGTYAKLDEARYETKAVLAA